MSIFWGIVLAVITYVILDLVMDGVLVPLLALVVFVAVAFGFDRVFPRR